ncbi:mitofilin family membrane protein [Aquibium sp. LZ166]|uniref:Mitofilin family membrane protein n=1 Tax=Aquibium pacificus TaxID=3153579 RepID=A0ABV3SGW1_9HYPH
MVKPPKIRHSRPRRDPVTIDLDPADVKREASQKEPPADAAPKTSATVAGQENTKAASPSMSATTSSSKAGKPEDVAAKPADKDEKVLAGKPESTGPSPTAAGPADEKNPSPKPEAAGSSSTPGSSKDDRKPATVTAGATTSVPPSGKPAPSRPAAPGASTPVSPKPTGDPKEPPTFGRGAAAEPRKTDRKDEPGPAPAPASRAPSRRGGVSAIAAGIIGAAVALAGAGALQYAGVLPVFQSGGTDGSEMAELRTQIETLREEIAAAGTDGAAADTARVDELASGLEQIRSQIADLQAAPPAGGGGENTEALQARLSELESTVSSLQGTEPGASPEDVATIRDRVSALEGQVSGASDSATAAQGAVTGIQERLASLETRLQELSGQVEEQSSDTGAALAIAAAGLKSAIDRGDPFMTELETFAAVAPDAPEVAALRDLAATGVPTRTAIAAQFDEVAARMIAAADPVAEDAGYFGRLLDSMSSLVSVRPIGEVEGEGVGPTVARMEAAIDGGNYARAIAEYETLPEASKAAGADFVAGVRARQSADDLVAKALAGALRA